MIFIYMDITRSNTRYMEMKINHRGYMIMGTTDNSHVYTQHQIG